MNKIEITFNALKALYNSTNGSGWNYDRGWDSINPPYTMKGFNDWFNVWVVDGKLTHLHLSKNHLEGTIPPEIGDLIDLEILFLDGNYLTGTLPPEIGKLTNLKELYLDHNHLTSTIPSEFGNLTNLEALTLDHNYLTGVVPIEIEKLVHLKRFNITRNCNLFRTYIPSEEESDTTKSLSK